MILVYIFVLIVFPLKYFETDKQFHYNINILQTGSASCAFCVAIQCNCKATIFYSDKFRKICLFLRSNKLCCLGLTFRSFDLPSICTFVHSTFCPSTFCPTTHRRAKAARYSRACYRTLVMLRSIIKTGFLKNVTTLGKN